MAIVFEQQKRPFNWVMLLFVIFIVGFLAFAVYFLFFAPSPKLDVVLPAPLQRASQISNLQFIDPSTVINSTAFRKLQDYVGPPSLGALGRPNPFVRF